MLLFTDDRTLDEACRDVQCDVVSLDHHFGNDFLINVSVPALFSFSLERAVQFD